MRLLLIGLLACTFATAHANPSLFEPQFLENDQAFVLSYQLNPEDETVTFSWFIQPGYYLYDAQFEIPGVHKRQLQRVHTSDVYDDEFFGRVGIVRQKAEITVPAATLANIESPMIQYRGCAEAGLCYPPTEKPVLLELQEFKTAGLTATTRNAWLIIIGLFAMISAALIIRIRQYKAQ